MRDTNLPLPSQPYRWPVSIPLHPLAAYSSSSSVNTLSTSSSLQEDLVGSPERTSLSCSPSIESVCSQSRLGLDQVRWRITNLDRNAHPHFDLPSLRLGVLDSFRRHPLTLMGSRVPLYRVANNRGLSYSKLPNKKGPGTTHILTLKPILAVLFFDPGRQPGEKLAYWREHNPPLYKKALFQRWGFRVSLSIPRLLLLGMGRPEAWEENGNSLLPILLENPDLVVDYERILSELHCWLLKVLPPILKSCGAIKHNKGSYPFGLCLKDKPEAALDVPAPAGLDLPAFDAALDRFRALDREPAPRKYEPPGQHYAKIRLPSGHRLKMYWKPHPSGIPLQRLELLGPCSSNSKMSRSSRLVGYEPVSQYMSVAKPFLAAVLNDVFVETLSPEQRDLLDSLSIGQQALLAKGWLTGPEVRSLRLPPALSWLIVRTPIHKRGYYVRLPAAIFLLSRVAEGVRRLAARNAQREVIAPHDAHPLQPLRPVYPSIPLPGSPHAPPSAEPSLCASRNAQPPRILAPRRLIVLKRP